MGKSLELHIRAKRLDLLRRLHVPAEEYRAHTTYEIRKTRKWGSATPLVARVRSRSPTFRDHPPGVFVRLPARRVESEHHQTRAGRPEVLILHFIHLRAPALAPASRTATSASEGMRF